MNAIKGQGTWSRTKLQDFLEIFLGWPFSIQIVYCRFVGVLNGHFDNWQHWLWTQRIWVQNFVGGGVNPILAMPAFWMHMVPQLGMGMRMRIHAVHADDAHMRICASRCACKNLDAHQPHTKEKMSHFEETLNKIEDGRWLPCYVCFSYIHLI